VPTRRSNIPQPSESGTPNRRPIEGPELTVKLPQYTRKHTKKLKS
jgi:hypothetical protein